MLTNFVTSIRFNSRRKVVMSFSSILKKARVDKGFGLRELSDKLNMDHAYLSRLENGCVSPSDKVVRHQVSRFFIFQKKS